MTEDLEIYSDGGARGNPGPGACAFVIKSGGKIIARGSRFLGNVTNNFAEYSGVLLALNYLRENKLSSKAIFFMDSELVVNQLNGNYKIKSFALKNISGQVKEVLSQVSTQIIFKSIPRSKNKTADLLVNEELDKNV